MYIVPIIIVLLLFFYELFNAVLLFRPLYIHAL